MVTQFLLRWFLLHLACAVQQLSSFGCREGGKNILAQNKQRVGVVTIFFFPPRKVKETCRAAQVSYCPSRLHNQTIWKQLQIWKSIQHEPTPGHLFYCGEPTDSSPGEIQKPRKAQAWGYVRRHQGDPFLWMCLSFRLFQCLILRCLQTESTTFRPVWK